MYVALNKKLTPNWQCVLIIKRTWSVELQLMPIGEHISDLRKKIDAPTFEQAETLAVEFAKSTAPEEFEAAR